jgi:glycosyltransferase involved in cell wall biosynthesis
MTGVVWYISKYFSLPEGRVGSRAYMLLREFPDHGYTPVVITAAYSHLFTNRELQQRSLRDAVDGIDITWLKLRKYAGARSLGRIWSWLEFEWQLLRLRKKDLPRPDTVIISSLSLLTIFNGLLLRWRYGCRLVFEVRDIWPLTIIEEGGFSPNNPFVMLLQWVEKTAYRRADAIIGTMPNLHEHVQELVGETAPVHCIPMGVDPDLLERDEEIPALYAKQHIPNGKFVVCHAGTIGQTNALEVLFATAELMQHTQIHFLLVGDGDLKADYKARFTHLPNLSFAPAVPKQQVQSLLKHCDVAFFSTLPSKVWKYGMSLNKLTDYMLAARPIIGSYSGYPSMLNEAGCGSFVPAGDAQALSKEILRLYRLPASEREKMGVAGRQWILANRLYSVLGRQYLDIVAPKVHTATEETGPITSRLRMF